VQSEYEPTNDDILRTRCRTSGVEEADFDFSDLSFRMIDVGGQRSERRKWIHCFEDVTAVIFCIATSEYDQYLREDITQNRMRESLLLFDEIVNSIWFSHTTFVLFMNKADLFEEKIRRIPLSNMFPEYKGGEDLEAARKYVTDLYVCLNQGTKQLFVHHTIAIDTKNVDFVFKAVRTTILKDVLGSGGIS